MGEREYVPHAVTALLHLAGTQQTNITVQHPGTDEATVTVTVPDCLLYLRTRGAAERIGQIWHRATFEARELPRAARAFQPSHRTDTAEPSVVVHTHGRPPGFVRLNREPGATTYLHVQIGGLTFFLHDQLSFNSVAGAFLRATDLGAQHLPLVDLRQASIGRRRQPGLAGQAAQGAHQRLEEVSRHPARVAGASFAQLETQLAAVIDPLQAALARVQAVRAKDGHSTRDQQDSREQPSAAQGTSQAADPQIPFQRHPTRRASDRHAPPLHGRPDHGSRSAQRHR